MNEITIFQNPEFGQIRTMMLPNGQVGFVGKDVAQVLGYKLPRKAILDHVEKDDVLKWNLIDAMGRNQLTTIINESGLYSLILASKLPKAKEFKHWVTAEVLPQIRKTGGYIPVKEGDDEKVILCKAVKILMNTVELQKQSIEQQKIELMEQDLEIARLTPKAMYAEDVLLSPTCYTMTEVAKSLSMTVFELQHRLHELRIIYRSPSGKWMLYADYLNRGYEAYRTSRMGDIPGTHRWTDSYLVWTERGREFVIKTLTPTLQ